MDRPRRTTRPPVRLIDTLPSSPSTTRQKRKTTQDDPAEQLHTLLTSPKSALTTMDVSDIFNAASWNMLSADSQNTLKTLLPPTAFLNFSVSIGADHPSAVGNGSDAVDSIPPANDVVDTALFTDPHFLAATHTLQDHIYCGWMSDSHVQKVAKYEEGIHDGTLAAPWKDELWERNNGVPRPATMPTNNGAVSSNERAGEAAEIKLVTLAQEGVLQVGDIIVLRRNFSALNIIVEKDAIIRSIHPKTHALTVLLEPGTSAHLPAPLVSPDPSPPTGNTQEAVITSPTQLETALLDNDGRVERGKRPNGNAWKSMTVWRWRGTAPWEDVGGGRWGRENHGTLFYLRGTYYHER
ncbi:hypothetical protein C0992_005135 [Termitomyces sp. T32_za158]|nr:hypothetical protein C0992_005135 [Termitomyces sp. T32_za158]